MIGAASTSAPMAAGAPSGVASIPSPPRASSLRPKDAHAPPAGAAGGQVGYRLQSNSWVFGLEFQGDWANLRGSNVSVLTPANTNRSRMDAFGLFTGQGGFCFKTRLVFLKGG